MPGQGYMTTQIIYLLKINSENIISLILFNERLRHKVSNTGYIQSLELNSITTNTWKIYRNNNTQIYRQTINKPRVVAVRLTRVLRVFESVPLSGVGVVLQACLFCLILYSLFIYSFSVISIISIVICVGRLSFVFCQYLMISSFPAKPRSFEPPRLHSG